MLLLVLGKPLADWLHAGLSGEHGGGGVGGSVALIVGLVVVAAVSARFDRGRPQPTGTRGSAPATAVPVSPGRATRPDVASDTSALRLRSWR